MSEARIEIGNDPDDPVRVFSADGSLVFDKAGWHNIRFPCGAPAPLALNGGGFVGCTLDQNHPIDVKHEVKVTW